MSNLEVQAPRLASWRAEWKFASAASVVFLLALLPRIFVHDMWRDEWQAWLLAVDGQPNWSTLLFRMGFEGHPMGWHFLLWLLGQIWPDATAMKLLHSLIASGIVLLICGFFPSSRPMRYLICAGYFFSFEYAVVSRNYGLGVLFLFAFAALRTAKPAAMIAPALCLAAAAQANVYAAILVSATSLWILQVWIDEGRPRPARFFAAAAIVAVALLLCGLQIKGSDDRQFAVAALDPSLSRFRQVMEGPWRSFFPLPCTRRLWWNSNFVEQWIPRNFTHLGMATLGAMVLALATWMTARGQRRSQLLWIYCSVGLLIFGVSFYPGFLRHQGHFFIAFLLAWWMREAGSTIAPTKLDARHATFLLILLMHASAGVFAVVADGTQRFTAARDVADFIRERYPRPSLIGHFDYTASPIAGMLEQQIFYPAINDWGSFVYWKAKKRGEIPPREFTTIAQRLRQQRPESEVLAILDSEVLIVPDPSHFRLLRTFTDSSISNECYYVYEYQSAAPMTLPAADR